MLYTLIFSSFQSCFYSKDAQLLQYGLLKPIKKNFSLVTDVVLRLSDLTKRVNQGNKIYIKNSSKPVNNNL